jgi:hypothetical protein
MPQGDLSIFSVLKNETSDVVCAESGNDARHRDHHPRRCMTVLREYVSIHLLQICVYVGAVERKVYKPLVLLLYALSLLHFSTS